MEELLKEARSKMEKSFNYFSEDISKLRLSQIPISLIEEIKVSCYGEVLPLNQLGTISQLDSQTLQVTPWDKSIISEIEAALKTAPLEAEIINAGDLIRICFPPLTQERKEELSKIILKKAEETKIALRNIRREILNQIKEKEKEKEISEDERYRGEEELNKLIQDFEKKIDELVEKKKKELIGE